MDKKRRLISFVQKYATYTKLTGISIPSRPIPRFPYYHLDTVPIGTASETLSEWADDEAGLEAVQKVVDSLDDIYALQDPLVEADVLRDILRDDRLHMLLQVRIHLLCCARDEECNRADD